MAVRETKIQPTGEDLSLSETPTLPAPNAKVDAMTSANAGANPAATLLSEKFAQVHEAMRAGEWERFWKAELATVRYYHSLSKTMEAEAAKSLSDDYHRELKEVRTEADRAARASVKDFLTAVQQVLPNLEDDASMQYAVGQALTQLSALTYACGGWAAAKD
jgi:hypothetical protein